MVLADVSDSEALLFKKKLAKLEKFRGRGTEMISVYIPSDTDRGAVMGQLNEEISQSSNIKSPQTRKNVQGALRKISGFLKQINFKIPQTGLVVFAGNVSESEGKTDIRLFTIKPIKELRTRLYWCDSQFHLEPLREMASPQEVYGLITIDKNESTIAALIGKRYDIIGKFTSNVAGKTRAGGQCLSSDTLIPLANGEIIEIKDTHNPLPVLSGNFEKNKVTETTITDKWETEKIPLKIVTKYPRFEIQSSKDHTFFVLENGKIMEKKAGQLSKGDELLFPEKLRVKGETQKLQTHFFNSYKISAEGRKILLKKRLEQKLHQKDLAKKIGATQTAISVIERGTRNIRHDFLYHYLTAVGENFNEFIEKHCKELQTHTLPKTLDKSLAQIIGYWLGDGNIEKERVCFSEQDKQLAEHYAFMLKNVFNANVRVRYRQSKAYYEIRAYGKPIVKFLQSEFPEKHSALDLEIPKKILKSPNYVVAGFLKGLFDAEGYASKGHLGFGVNNKKLAWQLQIVLPRFGIISSVHEYDNRRNPYTKNHRFTIQMSEKESLELFREHIGFSSQKKTKKLEKIIEKSAGKSSVRQVPILGSEVRKIIEAHNWKKQRFIEANMFLQNRRKISKRAFQRSIVEKAKTNPKLMEALQKVLESELLPAKITSITEGKAPISMTDISVQNQNFLAQGLVVHNSSKRFEHLREEAAQEFYKRISEKANAAFLPYEDKLKGIIVGGPGITKNYFLEKDLIDYRLKKKIIGTVDTSYTDESGIREVLQRSEELLKATAVIKEKKLLDRFFTELARESLASYGEKQVIGDIEIGKVDTLLLSEGINWVVLKFECQSCKKQFEVVVKTLKYNPSKEKCSECSSTQLEVLEEAEYLEYMVEKAATTGAKVEIISTDTPEGQQFLKSFEGIGAILRFR
ncbi:MAG: peptide chain release factor 1 [Candidatus Diapherotrites archaeon]|nr:peptide chain release factor 1 [Candidatus Diapherotrites archaeon]